MKDASYLNSAEHWHSVWSEVKLKQEHELWLIDRWMWAALFERELLLDMHSNGGNLRTSDGRVKEMGEK